MKRLNCYVPRLVRGIQRCNVMVNIAMKQLLFIFLLSFLHQAYADVVIKLEPDTISIGDSFKLTLSVDSAIDATPDFSVLDNDFTIIGTEKSVNYMVINQRAKSMIEWTLYLTPKKAGKIEIPSIMVGQEKSQAKTITVSSDVSQPEKQETQTTRKALDMQSNVDVENPYVHQQIIYTVKIFNKTNILDAAYTPPSIKGALFIPIGSGERAQTMIKGDIYAVETLKYAIFPQKSGKFVIHPAKFTAIIEDFPPQKVTLKGEEQILNIKPIPSNQRTWLPAKSLTLSEDNATLPNQSFKVGDTFTRVITVKAEGMPAQLLPNIIIKDGQGYQAYAEKPTIKNQFQGDTLVSTSTTKVTYVLNEPGLLTLPEINIHWFNTSTQHKETTTLPAENITVAGSALTKIDNPTKPTPIVKPSPERIKTSLRPHPFALLFLGLLTYAAFHTWRRTKTKQPENAPIKTLKKACQKNQAQLAKKALLDYFSNNTTNYISLSKLQENIHHPELNKAINNLNNQLYNPEPQTTWEGATLWQAFNAYLKSTAAPKKNSASIPPLNPS